MSGTELRKALVFDDDILILETVEAYFGIKQIKTFPHLYPTCPMIERGVATCPLTTPIYSLILSDNDMPRQTGIDFFEELQRRGCKIPNHRKALMTGFLPRKDYERARSLGLRVLKKTCSFAVLDLWLDEILASE